MIGELPKRLTVGGTDWPIRSDYRDVLNVFTAMDDPDLKENEKWIVALSILFPDFPDMLPADYPEAIEKAMWFFSLGDPPNKEHGSAFRLYDWQKDEQYIISAVNKVVGREIRSMRYLHYWTFMGYFNEIGEGVFSMIVEIRSKRAKGKKLEPYEKDFYRENRELVDIVKRSKEQLEEMERINKLLG